MELIESLKQTLKAEVSNRKESEEIFMHQAEKRTQEIRTHINLDYLNSIYTMKEKLTTFEQRKATLQSKIAVLSATVDKKLSYNK